MFNPHHLLIPFLQISLLLTFICSPHINTHGAFMVIHNQWQAANIWVASRDGSQLRQNEATLCLPISISYCEQCLFFVFYLLLQFLCLYAFIWWFFCLKMPRGTVLQCCSGPPSPEGCDMPMCLLEKTHVLDKLPSCTTYGLSSVLIKNIYEINVFQQKHTQNKDMCRSVGKNVLTRGWQEPNLLFAPGARVQYSPTQYLRQLSRT